MHDSISNMKILFIFFSILICSKKTSCQSLSKPNGLIWSEMYSTSISMTWENDPNLNYTVVAEPWPASISDCVNGASTDKPPFTVSFTRDGTRIKPGTEYVIGVCAVDGRRASSSRDSSSITTGPPPPDHIQISNSSVEQLHVTWNDPCSTGCDKGRTADYYDVFYHSVDANEASIRINNPSNRFASISNLTSSTRYVITVRITSNVITRLNKTRFVRSDRSQEVIGITNPSIPRNIRLKSTETTINISWEAPDGYADGVVIESPTNAFQKTELDASVDSYTISNLSSNTLYEMCMYLTLKSLAGELQSDKVIRQIKTQDLPAANLATTIGIIVGCILGVLFLVILIVVCWYRRKKASKKNHAIQRGSQQPKKEAAKIYENERNEPILNDDCAYITVDDHRIVPACSSTNPTSSQSTSNQNEVGYLSPMECKSGGKWLIKEIKDAPNEKSADKKSDYETINVPPQLQDEENAYIIRNSVRIGPACSSTNPKSSQSTSNKDEVGYLTPMECKPGGKWLIEEIKE